MTLFEKHLSFLLAEFGKEVVLNGVNTKVLITDENTGTTYARQIRIYTDKALYVGDNLFYQDNYWYIINQPIKHDNYHYATAQQVNDTVTFYPPKLTNYQGLPSYGEIIPAIIESDKWSVVYEQSGGFSVNNLVITVPADKITYYIEAGDKIVKYGKNWKVSGVDRTKDGLLIVYVELDTLASIQSHPNYVLEERYSSYDTQLNFASYADMGGKRVHRNLSTTIPWNNPNMILNPTFSGNGIYTAGAGSAVLDVMTITLGNSITFQGIVKYKGTNYYLDNVKGSVSSPYSNITCTYNNTTHNWTITPSEAFSLETFEVSFYVDGQGFKKQYMLLCST